MDTRNDSDFLIINKKDYQNKHRNKQYGFYFNADKCLMCHSCEAACAEKNILPSHIAFRKVGFVEGGKYPDYKRINISMACNHCEDPACLKGCPTRAYTKYEEYGAVIQDPETCFGCQYCTWVCPYNAPVFDKQKGVVNKCNFCIDKLEQGEQPACVESCVGGALEFSELGQIEDGKKEIPGFPTPQITNPSIRFNLSKSLPEELERGDGMNIKYRLNGDGNYNSVIGKGNKQSAKVESSLRSQEDPLLIFTLIAQMVIGSVASMLCLSIITNLIDFFNPLYLIVMLILMGGAMTISVLHLGRPQYSYRALNNLKYSWVSREIVAVNTIFDLLLFFLFNSWFDMFPDWSVTLGKVLFLVAAPVAIYCMGKLYQIKARSYWRHFNTFTSFFSTALILGPLFTGSIYGIKRISNIGESNQLIFWFLCILVIIGVALQITGHFFHIRYLKKNSAESLVSLNRIKLKFGFINIARYTGLGIIALFTIISSIYASPLLLSFTFVLSLFVLYLDRALFYVLVTPMTMPGAFFWKNKSFESYAKETGLGLK